MPRRTPDADERAVLAQLCRDLDDLPLAIELAAAQCRALSLQQLVEQLGDRFALLQSGRSVDGRHASMAATVAWSYDTLAPEERNLFEALGLLEGSFDLEGVLAVWGQSSYLAAFLGLINKSLVTVLDGSPKRYRILETLRQYAAQRRSEPRTRDVQRRIVDWIAALADQVDVELYGPAAAAGWSDWTKTRTPFARPSAGRSTTRPLTCASPSGWSGSGTGAGTPWRHCGPSHRSPPRPGAEAKTSESEIRATEAGVIGELASAADSVSALPRSLRLRGAVGLMLLRYLAGDHPGLARELDQARALVATSGDDAARSYALATIGYFEAGSGQTDQALTDARASLVLALTLVIQTSWHPYRVVDDGDGPPASPGGMQAAGEYSAAEAVRHADACPPAGGAPQASTWIMCKAQDRAGAISPNTPWPDWPASSPTRPGTGT